jgi:hypothetical protein
MAATRGDMLIPAKIFSIGLKNSGDHDQRAAFEGGESGSI